MVKKVLFIEGTTDDTNGDLRKGFRLLLEKKLKDKMPQIITANDRNSTVRKFINSKEDGIICVLIDLDGKNNLNIDTISELKNSTINKLGLLSKQNSVFFMVQEMEAWFLSQPKVLENYFEDKRLSTKIPKKNTELIPDPSDFLINITKDTRKGKYHKVKHGVELLCLLDIDQLSNNFIDVQKLIEKLN